MGSLDMPLQSLLLAEDLIAWRMILAAILVWTLMSGLVNSQSLACSKRLVAAFVRALVVTNIGVCALDVVLEVALPEIVFVAQWVGTFERPLIGMGSDVFLQPGRAVEGLVAAFVGALQALLATVGCALGGGGCRG